MTQEALSPDLRDATQNAALYDITPNPWNPHRMTEQEQNDLISSVMDGGQWRPILVVEMDVPDDESPEDPPTSRYRIVDGEHLWQALTSLHMQGLWPDEARVMVLGLNSEIELWRQKEIGQTMNHGLRGSIEDLEKTRELLNDVLKHRSKEIVAKRMGIGVAGIRHLTEVAPAKRGSRTAVATATSGMNRAVRTVNSERKNYTIALLFESAEELQSFEDDVQRAGDALGLHRKNYKNRTGQHRLEVLSALLTRQLQEHDDQEA